MFEKLDHVDAAQRHGGFPYLRSHPLTSRAHRRGALARRHRPPPVPPRQRARAHRGAGARAGADGHARRCAAPLAGAATPTGDGSAADKLLDRLRERARVDPAARLGARRCGLRQRRWRSPAPARTAARAPSAPSRCCRRSRCSSAARRRRRARRCSPMPATARGRCCCSSAQIALRRGTGGHAPTAPTLKAQRRRRCRPGSRVHPDDSLAWGALGQTWGRLGLPLRALRAEAESRYALGDLLGAVDRLRAAPAPRAQRRRRSTSSTPR